jgi:hypothetical protein
MRKTYSAVTQRATGWPSLIAGLNLILQAALIALSVSPAGSPFKTLTREILASAASSTFNLTNPWMCCGGPLSCTTEAVWK